MMFSGKCGKHRVRYHHWKEATVLEIEFTVEPFIEGSPGPHVTAAVAAVEKNGVAVEFGPFGSSFTAPDSRTPAIVADLLAAAYGNGATHVSVHVARQEQ